MKRSIYLGVIGLGTVGSGLLKILKENQIFIEKNSGKTLILKKASDLKPEKLNQQGFPKDVFTQEASEVLEDKDIAIVVEAIGGVEPARQFILQAINNGKHVVTSNKEVLAKHGEEIYQLARTKKVYLLSEGAVAGGLPILRMLRTSFQAEEIQEVYGIVNGTTNFILSKMDETGSSFESVLSDAKSLGIAEANPEDDLSGRDAAYKSVILASHAFQTNIKFQDISYEGILNVEKQDLDYAREFGFTIKLLSVLRKEENNLISVMVYPALVSLKHQLAKVNQHYNAVYVRGNFVGEVMLYGQGAGGAPTGSAVLSDILEIANLIDKEYDNSILPTFISDKKLKPAGEVASQFYLRMWVKDKVGVLEKIAGVFARNEVSIAAVIQKSVKEDNAEIVILTHQVKTKNIQKAVSEIKALPTTVSIKNVLRVGI